MKANRHILFFLLCLLSFITVEAQSSFDEKVTSVSNVRLTVTNVGTFGNAFRGYRDGSSNESCEYPAGSGTEHLFESGIWIGADRNGQQFVSTAAVDASQGYITGGSGFEYTTDPGASLRERSSFRDSPFYSPDAISQQDFVSSFTDKNVIIPGTNIQINNHQSPLFVQVNMRTYNFNFAFSDYVVFVDMDIINLGNQGAANDLDSVYFGLWANTVVRNVNVTPAGSGGVAFYNKGGNGYNDSLFFAYCYDYNGDVGFTNSYISQKFLGATDKFGFHYPTLDSSFQANYNAWSFNNSSEAVFFAPTGDDEQYIKMTRGLEDSPCWDSVIANSIEGCETISYIDNLNRAGNRSDLLSVGPFRNFQTGDTISIAYAFVLAPKIDDGEPYTYNTPAQQADLFKNIRRVQTAFNGEDENFNGILDEGEDINNNGKIDRFILPEPPEIPRTKIVAENKRVDIYWSNNSEFSIDPISQEMDFEGYRIYLSKLGFDVSGVSNLQRDLIAADEFDIVNNGFANEIGLKDIKLDQPVSFDGDTTLYYYKYSFENLLNGWQYAVSVTAFDRGNAIQNIEPLESSVLGNNFRIFPGTTPNKDLKNNEPFAYPNPYYFGASWEGRSNFQEQSRKLIFANLPERCMIRIFTPAGDLIDEILHDQNYDGSDIRWYETFGAESAEKNTFSGGEHAWDLLSNFTQIISRGIYVFVVEDLDSGEVKQGKFTILK